jgi:hypothetical protein
MHQAGRRTGVDSSWDRRIDILILEPQRRRRLLDQRDYMVDVIVRREQRLDLFVGAETDAFRLEESWRFRNLFAYSIGHQEIGPLDTIGLHVERLSLFHVPRYEALENRRECRTLDDDMPFAIIDRCRLGSVALAPKGSMSG